MHDRPTAFLTTYHPLVSTALGRHVCERHDLPPFVDHSIRREPDLEYWLPTITALCRASQFAPRLHPGDVVVYLTVKGRWGADHPPHRRLTAVLRVRERFETHGEAARWFASRNYQLPTNCLVPGNPPKPWHLSAVRKKPRSCTASRFCQAKDRIYQDRARRHGVFLVCTPLLVDLSWEAPVVNDRDLIHAFGRVPGTRNPPAVEISQIAALLRRLHRRVRLSSP